MFLTVMLGAREAANETPLDDVRLIFSDAEHNAHGRILRSASAEAPDGQFGGSVLGLIQPKRTVRWAEFTTMERETIYRKEQRPLPHNLRDPTRIHYVIDDDDGTVPSDPFKSEFGTTAPGRGTAI